MVRARGEHWRAHSHCHLPISVGQAYHSGAKMLATIDWINRHADAPFTRCTIVLADTLQRHNLTALAAQDAWDQAHRAGSAWLDRNNAALDACTVPLRVIRWSELLARPGYQAFRDRLTQLQTQNAAFAAALDQAVASWLARQAASDPAAGQRSRAYLMEELACTAVLASDTPAACCYPGSLEHLAALRKIAFPDFVRTVAGTPQHLAAFEETRLHLSRRRRPSPAVPLAVPHRRR
ncbi:hypothetical protein GCM10010411_75830 [Actinomadura fulvescens]|uniref:Cyclodipeptide synthase n=1 Tax=Actinomadura fulvescens TaxID=46160 RepID=A0ABN3QK83_9ACTN